MPNQQDLKNRFYAFYELNKEKRERFIRDHFLDERYSGCTMHRFLNDTKNGMPLSRKKESGKNLYSTLQRMA